jgi:glyoxylase I family protein
MAAKIPSRLHHTAFVTRDMEATRAFYEDVLGFPLVQTWAERDVLFGKERIYCHCFFGLADGSALAFFQFVDPDDQAEFGPELAPSPFRHIALNVDQETQQELEARIAKAGIEAPATYVLEHGYCRSVYVTDPNGMILEFTHDAPEAIAMAPALRDSAHETLRNWLAGQHASTNMFRD